MSLECRVNSCDADWVWSDAYRYWLVERQYVIKIIGQSQSSTFDAEIVSFVSYLINGDRSTNMHVK